MLSLLALLASTAVAAASPEPAQLPRHAVFGAAVADKPAGTTVVRVLPNSPAAAAGLHDGDVLVRFAGAAVPNTATFLTLVHEHRANESVAVDVQRNKTQIALHALLAAAPNEKDTGVTTIYGAVSVDNTLRRTLVTVPDTGSSRHAAVLLVGGIGCYSVDVATNPQDPYERLTHDLSRASFVTMRLEKSGIGDSQGPPCKDVDFESESRSYAVALRALKNDPHVDPNRVYLFGHSIGSIIAPRLALHESVAGVIVAEAVGRDWPEYEVRNARRQLELSGASPAEVDRNLIEKASCMQRLLIEKQSEPEIERTMPSCKAHNGVYPVTAAYVQQVALLNIIEPWSKLKVRVLAIYGASDYVTELADHQRIVDVVNAANAGHATLKVIDGMDHAFGRVATQKASYEAGQKGAPLLYDTDLSGVVVAWLNVNT